MLLQYFHINWFSHDKVHQSFWQGNINITNVTVSVSSDLRGSFPKEEKGLLSQSEFVNCNPVLGVLDSSSQYWIHPIAFPPMLQQVLCQNKRWHFLTSLSWHLHKAFCVCSRFDAMVLDWNSWNLEPIFFPVGYDGFTLTGYLYLNITVYLLISPWCHTRSRRVWGVGLKLIYRCACICLKQGEWTNQKVTNWRHSFKRRSSVTFDWSM